MQTVLLITLLVLTPMLSGLILFSRRFQLAETALAVSLTGFAASLALDWLVLQSPQEAMELERVSLTVAGLACWSLVVFSLFYARSYDSMTVPRLRLAILLVLFALPMLPAFLPPQALLRPSAAETPWIMPLTLTGFVLNTLMMSSLILALYNLEATLVSATHANRWRIKFFVLGCMVVGTAQVLSATPGLLYLTLDLSLSPTREIGLLLGVFLMGFSLLTRGGQVKIVFSQRLAYNSLVVLLSGVYLIAIGLFGKNNALRNSVSFSQMDLGLALVGGLVLTGLLLSETARRKVGVTLRKYFYKDKYDYRQQWLNYTQRLGKADEPNTLYRAILEGFCDTFGFANAALFLRRANGSAFDPVFILELTLPDALVHKDDPICPAPIPKMSVKDLRPLRLPSQASFSVPLRINDTLTGFILLGRPFNPKENYDEEDFELMEAMARQSFLAIHNLNLASELAVAKEMEIMGKVSAFMLHDLKNLVYTLSLMVENAKHYMGNPEFQQDMLQSLDNTVSRMNRLITQLKGLPSKESLSCEDVNLLDLVHESAKAVPGAHVEIKGAPASALVDREEIGKVLVNLLRNAHEACHGHDPVEVEVGAWPQPFVKVRDSGFGMSEEFLQTGLFVPFATTKENGMGIGLYQSKHIIEAHNGRLEVESTPGHGSTFTVVLPDSSPRPTA